MSTKKPTEKQLAARKRFAEMAKNGTLAKKRAKASLKAPATKTPAKRKKVISAKKICRAVIKVPGINSRTGQLLKGWHYKNGKPVKATKKVSTKGLKNPLSKSAYFPGRCPACRTNTGGTYVPPQGQNCDFKAGDTCITTLGKPAKKSTKKATAKQTAAQKAFKANSAKAREMVKSGKAKNLKEAWLKLIFK